MDKNYLIIEEMFERVGLFGVDSETIETFSWLKNVLISKPIYGLIATAAGLEDIYRSDFPEYSEDENKEEYVEKIIQELIYKSYVMKENGGLLNSMLRSFEVSEMVEPGMSKKLSWYYKLFNINKN